MTATVDTLRGTSPYPPSSVLALDELGATARREDLDGDDWPITWAEDDAQYAAYGDGWGCRPIEKPTKLNTGLCRLTGDPPEFRGEEMAIPWFGSGAQDPNMKGCGLLAVDGTLYHFLRCQRGEPGERVRRQVASKLIWSPDLGRTWENGDYADDARDMRWFFEEPDHAFHSPTFLQAGKAFAEAQDEYVYVYSAHEDSRRRADHLDLARVPRGEVTDRAAYEFFAGLDGSSGDRPRWTRDIAARVPSVTFPGHIGPGDVVYSPPLRRYLLVTCAAWEALQESASRLAILDAPHPWGPWTTVGYVAQWGSGVGGDCRYDPRIPTKWIGGDGTECTLVYSDRIQSDKLNYQSMRLRRVAG